MYNLKRRRDIHDTGMKLMLGGTFLMMFMLGVSAVTHIAILFGGAFVLLGALVLFHEDIAHAMVNWRAGRGLHGRVDDLEERQVAMANKLGWKWARIPDFGFWKGEGEDVGALAADQARRLVYYPDGPTNR